MTHPSLLHRAARTVARAYAELDRASRALFEIDPSAGGSTRS